MKIDKKYAILLTSHVIFGLLLAAVDGFSLASVFYVFAIFIYAEIIDQKHRILGTIFSAHKIKGMISAVFRMPVILDWSLPTLAVLIAHII